MGGGGGVGGGDAMTSQSMSMESCFLIGLALAECVNLIEIMDLKQEIRDISKNS